MSSDMISLGWAVSTFSVTSTVKRTQKEGAIVFIHVDVCLQDCCEVSYLNTPAASSYLQKHVANILLCTLSIIVSDLSTSG